MKSQKLEEQKLLVKRRFQELATEVQRRQLSTVRLDDKFVRALEQHMQTMARILALGAACGIELRKGED